MVFSCWYVPDAFGAMHPSPKVWRTMRALISMIFVVVFNLIGFIILLWLVGVF